MNAQKEVDFNWLAEKTSTEMVAFVREIITNAEIRKEPILNVEQRERIDYQSKVNLIELYIITDLSCHYFSYNARHDFFIHDRMSRFVIRDFYEMEKDRISQLSKGAVL